jgi:hypothetical protein
MAGNSPLSLAALDLDWTDRTERINYTVRRRPPCCVCKSLIPRDHEHTFALFSLNHLGPVRLIFLVFASRPANTCESDFPGLPVTAGEKAANELHMSVRKT